MATVIARISGAAVLGWFVGFNAAIVGYFWHTADVQAKHTTWEQNQQFCKEHKLTYSKREGNIVFCHKEFILGDAK